MINLEAGLPEVTDIKTNEKGRTTVHLRDGGMEVVARLKGIHPMEDGTVTVEKEVINRDSPSGVEQVRSRARLAFPEPQVWSFAERLRVAAERGMLLTRGGRPLQPERIPVLLDLFIRKP